MGGRLYGTDFARIYHERWSRFAAEQAPRIVRLLRRHGIRRGRVADLACGTGVLAAALSRAGYDVVGIDASPAMLRIARRVAPKAAFRLGSFTDVPPCDAVLCTFDALNYLGRSRLAAVFRAVARALRPGGVFLFDMNTLHGLRRQWRGVRVHRSRDWLVTLDLSTRGRRGFFTITGFVRDGRRWRRFVEPHVERGYTVAEIRRCARGWRLRRLGGYDGAPAGPNPRRAYFVATRSVGLV